MVKVLYFAGLKDMTGKAEEQLDVQGLTVNQLIEQLVETYQTFNPTGVRAAINEEFVHHDNEIKDGDVVAFIPPVSGG